MVASEVDMVISETFCCNESSINIHHLYCLTKSLRYVELLSIDLWRSNKDYTTKVDLWISECLKYQWLSPVMSCHLFRCRSDTC